MTQRFVLFNRTENGRMPAIMCGYMRSITSIFVSSGIMDMNDGQWQFWEDPFYDVDFELEPGWDSSPSTIHQLNSILQHSIALAADKLDCQVPDKETLNSLAEGLIKDAQGNLGNLRYVHCGSSIQAAGPEHQL